MGGWEGSAGSGAVYVIKGDVESIDFEGPWLIEEREGSKSHLEFNQYATTFQKTRNSQQWNFVPEVHATCIDCRKQGSS